MKKLSKNEIIDIYHKMIGIHGTCGGVLPKFKIGDKVFFKGIEKVMFVESFWDKVNRVWEPVDKAWYYHDMCRKEKIGQYGIVVDIRDQAITKPATELYEFTVRFDDGRELALIGEDLVKTKPKYTRVGLLGDKPKYKKVAGCTI